MNTPVELNNAITEERYYYLDAARALALLIGIFFHGLSFMISYLPPMLWAVKDSHTNMGIDVFFYLAHTFRMQAFFLVAGFFAHLVFCKKGLKGFLIHRVKRITLPLLIFWPFIYFSISMLWIWGYQHMGYFSHAPELAKYSFMQLVMGNFISGQ